VLIWWLSFHTPLCHGLLFIYSSCTGVYKSDRLVANIERSFPRCTPQFSSDRGQTRDSQYIVRVRGCYVIQLVSGRTINSGTKSLRSNTTLLSGVLRPIVLPEGEDRRYETHLETYRIWIYPLESICAPVSAWSDPCPETILLVKILDLQGPQYGIGHGSELLCNCIVRRG
jgi:hypothetical protein